MATVRLVRFQIVAPLPQQRLPWPRRRDWTAHRGHRRSMGARAIIAPSSPGAAEEHRDVQQGERCTWGANPAAGSEASKIHVAAGSVVPLAELPPEAPTMEPHQRGVKIRRAVELQRFGYAQT